MLDTSMLSFLAPCFAASLILAGIHAYLGVHVVERGVIFVTSRWHKSRRWGRPSRC